MCKSFRPKKYKAYWKMSSGIWGYFTRNKKHYTYNSKSIANWIKDLIKYSNNRMKNFYCVFALRKNYGKKYLMKKIKSIRLWISKVKTTI